MLISFPQKNDNKFYINELKSSMIENHYDRNNIELLVERYLNKILKASLFNLLTIMQENCSIKIDLDEENINKINELRNECVNDYYGYKNTDSISNVKIKEYIGFLNLYMDEIIEKINCKYSKYTRKNLLKDFGVGFLIHLYYHIKNVYILEKVYLVVKLLVLTLII